METSSPLTKLQNAITATTSHRRSSVATPIGSVQNVNDDQESSSRHSLITLEKRLFAIPSGGSPLFDTSKFMSENDMNDHFKICMKLFTDNKISTQNAWNLHIIDLLKRMAQTQDSEIFQLVGTSLDISAKVYSIRVDDIHSDGMKLASSLSRVSSKQMQLDLDENGVMAENPVKENTGAKKKDKAKRLRMDKKNTICKDPKTLQGSLPKLDSGFFSTRMDTESSGIDNLFTNKLKLDSSGYKFMLLSNEKAWTEQPDPVIQGLENPNRKKYPLTVNPLVNFKICEPFSGFQLDEWDPDEEDKHLASQTSTFIEKQQEVLFDEDGVPIHELDGSIHDLFENPTDDAEDIQSVHEEVAHQVKGEIANVLEFTPIPTQGTVRSEYSYNPVITSPSGELLDMIWAGPSHWKFKFNSRTTAKFSGVITDCEKRAKSGKKKAPAKKMDYHSEVEDLNLMHRLKMRRKPRTANVKKITLPLPHYPHSKMPEYINQLLMRRGMCPVKKAPTVENSAHFEASAYRYENPNDSQYFLQHSEEAGAGDKDMPGPSTDIVRQDTEEHRLAEYEFMGENLVDTPEMIPKVDVPPYALQAKKMDMKKLKSAVWQNLTDVAISTGKNTQEREGKVVPTTFSKMYNELPALLPHKMQKRLSCPLAFVALLHLCNEENLSLIPHEGNKDFSISGP